jgi:hypothetical protein
MMCEEGRMRVMLMGVLKLTRKSNVVIANSWDDCGRVFGWYVTASHIPTSVHSNSNST